MRPRIPAAAPVKHAERKCTELNALTLCATASGLIPLFVFALVDIVQSKTSLGQSCDMSVTCHVERYNTNHNYWPLEIIYQY